MEIKSTEQLQVSSGPELATKLPVKSTNSIKAVAFSVPQLHEKLILVATCTSLDELKTKQETPCLPFYGFPWRVVQF